MSRSLPSEFIVSRLSALAAHPRRTVGALAVVLAAVGVTVGSGANFTAHSANPANTFTAGTLTIGSGQASALLSAGNLKPGGTANGTIDIENTGTLSGAFTLSTSNVADSSPSLLGQLGLKIEDCGAFSGSTAPTCGSGRVLHNAKVTPVGSLDLGTFAAGEKHRYRFDVTLPASTDNSFQGKSASIEFDWDAAAS
ncbi:MAG: spore coat-associated protein [Solirubrobacteraceae bacterium]|nr:spore coat-associated protein [Solirubrobacteraceae bacterium]